MDPTALNSEQMAMLLRAMGVAVDGHARPNARNPTSRSHEAGPPSPLLAGLGFLLVFMMVLRTPGVAGAMMDLMQVIRMAAVAVMLVSGAAIVSKLCAPPPRRARPRAALAGRRYALVALTDAGPGPVVRGAARGAARGARGGAGVRQRLRQRRLRRDGPEREERGRVNARERERRAHAPDPSRVAGRRCRRHRRLVGVGIPLYFDDSALVLALGLRCHAPHRVPEGALRDRQQLYRGQHKHVRQRPRGDVPGVGFFGEAENVGRIELESHAAGVHVPVPPLDRCSPAIA